MIQYECTGHLVLITIHPVSFSTKLDDGSGDNQPLSRSITTKTTVTEQEQHENWQIYDKKDTNKFRKSTNFYWPFQKLFLFTLMSVKYTINLPVISILFSNKKFINLNLLLDVDANILWDMKIQTTTCCCCLIMSQTKTKYK